MSRTPVLTHSIGSTPKGPSNAILGPSGAIPGEGSESTPPLETPIIFLAGEFGCTPRWYPGFTWQSSEPGQEVQFYIYPWALGLSSDYPPFHAPPYLGQWQPITDPEVLALFGDIPMTEQPLPSVPSRCPEAWRLLLAWGECKPKTAAHEDAGAAYKQHIHSCYKCLTWLDWLRSH